MLTRFKEVLTEIGVLNNIAAVLQWDQETQLPPKAAEVRGDQLAYLSGVIHEKVTSPELQDLLLKLEGKAGDLPHDQRVNLREVRRTVDKETKLPKDMVEEFARLRTQAHVAWNTAKKNADFSTFAPVLAKVFEFTKKRAQLVGGLSANASGDAIYDVLLDDYEPGAKVADIAPLFSGLRTDVVAFLKKIAASPVKLKKLEGRFDIETQRELGLWVATKMGFDFDAGRIEVSSHPFCMGMTANDVRITTRFQETDFTGSLYGVIHEAGHGLYEQGLDDSYRYMPAGEAASTAIHESQSRLWENVVGRSPEFCRFLLPKLKSVFPQQLAGVDEMRLIQALNVVAPSMIRVEADEVTYNLHVLLRFEIERAVLGGQIAIDDLPKAWNQKMEEYLGVQPNNDAEGVLQDVHWSFGGIGYFPTYTLGNMYASQFFEAAEKAIPKLREKIAAGEFAPLREWLRANVHRHGKLKSAAELVSEVTGQKLGSQAFLSHIHRKFGELYGV